jgi:hypothetical protein
MISGTTMARLQFIDLMSDALRHCSCRVALLFGSFVLTSYTTLSIVLISLRALICKSTRQTEHAPVEITKDIVACIALRSFLLFFLFSLSRRMWRAPACI